MLSRITTTTAATIIIIALWLLSGDTREAR